MHILRDWQSVSHRVRDLHQCQLLGPIQPIKVPADTRSPIITCATRIVDIIFCKIIIITNESLSLYYLPSTNECANIRTIDYRETTQVEHWIHQSMTGNESSGRYRYNIVALHIIRTRRIIEWHWIFFFFLRNEKKKSSEKNARYSVRKYDENIIRTNVV